MKVITEKIVTNIEKYEAFDGTVFDNKEDCLEYEKYQMYAVPFNKIRMKPIDACEFGCGNEDDNCYLMVLKDSEEVRVFNDYVGKCVGMDDVSGNVVDESWIGKLLIVNFGWGYNWCMVEVLSEWMEKKKRVWDREIGEWRLSRG